MKYKTLLAALLAITAPILVFSDQSKRDVLAEIIGRELAIIRHLADDDEFTLPITDLLAHGKKLFEAVWTEQEGARRPLTKGTGRALSDQRDPLTNARSFNRVSGPDANSCA